MKFRELNFGSKFQHDFGSLLKYNRRTNLSTFIYYNLGSKHTSHADLNGSVADVNGNADLKPRGLGFESRIRQGFFPLELEFFS
jgi:hypothetical protein